MTNSTAPSSVKPLFAGLGVPDVNKAIGAPLPLPAAAAQPATGATGTGTLEGARGTAHVTNGSQLLTGETGHLRPAVERRRLGGLGRPRGPAEPGGGWRGRATGWSSSGSWDARSWTGSDWSARSWTARSWTDHTWSAAGWNARSWTDSTWLGSAWASTAWAAAAWS